MKNLRKSLPLIGVILLIIFAASWLVFRQFQKAALAKNMELVDTVAVRRMDLSEKIDATGDVVTEKNASIYSPYSATVKEILVKPGDAVHKGDVLLVLQLKDADLINYGAGWKSSLEQAQANLAVAQKALERETILYKAQGTTIDDLESAQSKVQQYQAQVNEYNLKLASLIKNGVDDNNNILIKAPFDAEISWINVKLEEAVTTSDELLTLGGASVVRVEASVDQGDIDQIKVGLNATIKANDQNRTIIPGVVTSFGSTGTTSSNVVTFPVVIKPGESNNSGLADPDGKKDVNLRKARKFESAGLSKPVGATALAPVKSTGTDLGNLLKAGMTVDVTIMVSSHPDVLAVPLRAVSEENGQAVVKVLSQGKLVAKQISLGYRNSDYAEVLEGLAEGDQVAILKTNAAANNSAVGTTRRSMMGGPMGPPM